MRGDKAHEDLGAEAYLQYVEHPNRVQRSQHATLRFHSRKLVRNAGYEVIQLLPHNSVILSKNLFDFPPRGCYSIFYPRSRMTESV